MILPSFDYEAPESISTACSLLAQAEGNAAIVAGGTDLIVQMRQRTLLPKLVISLKKIPELKGISYSTTKGLKIGAMVSLHQLANSNKVKSNFPVIVETASLVGAMQHQFMGTIGGNICLNTRCLYYNQPANLRRFFTPCRKLGGNTCHTIKGANKCYAVYTADLGSVLYALDAAVIVNSNQGEKVITLEKLFTGDPIRPINLKIDELITEIIVPPSKPYFARYYKLRLREAVDFPQIGVGLIAFPEDRDYRVVINAVEGRPLRFKDLELMLLQNTISEDLIVNFANKVVERIKPQANVTGSSSYRRKMAGILVRKAFEEMVITS